MLKLLLFFSLIFNSLITNALSTNSTNGHNYPYFQQFLNNSKKRVELYTLNCNDNSSASKDEIICSTKYINISNAPDKCSIFSDCFEQKFQYDSKSNGWISINRLGGTCDITKTIRLKYNNKSMNWEYVVNQFIKNRDKQHISGSCENTFRNTWIAHVAPGDLKIKTKCKYFEF